MMPVRRGGWVRFLSSQVKWCQELLPGNYGAGVKQGQVNQVMNRPLGYTEQGAKQGPLIQFVERAGSGLCYLLQQRRAARV